MTLFATLKKLVSLIKDHHNNKNPQKKHRKTTVKIKDCTFTHSQIFFLYFLMMHLPDQTCEPLPPILPTNFRTFVSVCLCKSAYFISKEIFWYFILLFFFREASPWFFRRSCLVHITGHRGGDGTGTR